jgi:predicted Rossmann fold nucleotide-binding protein DprA/Smf involved in DNA uptake
LPTSWAALQPALEAVPERATNENRGRPRNGLKTGAVVEFLAVNGVRSTEQIARALGESINGTRSRLFELERQGRVDRVGKLGRQATWGTACP